MSHVANCTKCKLEVKWSNMSDRVINTLEEGLLITGTLIWNKEDKDWRIICRSCLQKIAFQK